MVQLQSSVASLEAQVSELTIQLQQSETDKISSETLVNHWKYKSSQLTEKYEQEKAAELAKHT